MRLLLTFTIKWKIFGTNALFPPPLNDHCPISSLPSAVSQTNQLITEYKQLFIHYHTLHDRKRYDTISYQQAILFLSNQNDKNHKILVLHTFGVFIPKHQRKTIWMVSIWTSVYFIHQRAFATNARRKVFFETLNMIHNVEKNNKLDLTTKRFINESTTLTQFHLIYWITLVTFIGGCKRWFGPTFQSCSCNGAAYPVVSLKFLNPN